MRAARTPAALIAVAAALALAACGDSEGDETAETAATSATATTTPAGTETTITVEPDRDCGGIAGQGASIFDIRAANIGCGQARAIASDWVKRCEGESCRAIGFDCAPEVLGPEEMRVTCVREGATVTFFYGV
jgi:hypothetical protein